MDAPSDCFGSVQDSTFPPKDAQCRFAGCCCVPHEDSIPRAGYNLLQLSVNADNSIQSWFRSSGNRLNFLRSSTLLLGLYEIGKTLPDRRGYVLCL